MSSEVPKPRVKKVVLYACEFEISARVPHELFSLFLENEINYLGIRGWAQEVAHGCIKGRLEGEIRKMEKLKTILINSPQFGSKINGIVFGELKKINKYNGAKFEIIC
ncbi:acylphosphatase-2-like [Anastrepha ludens]|uniref:acylphosphatase-2-like n=1 Tax=Anastrepha ludens TaxID=28586 RepID=UPI0023B0EE59|nr:acylphosphatase-2-like [Anastrepha ludens]XP_053950750.1 acylphosphatase-2-like [Anastrepha ludens]